MMHTDEMQQKLRSLPGVDRMLAHPALASVREAYGRELMTHAVRSAIAHARQRILSGGSAPAADQLAEAARRTVTLLAAPSLKPVINATGILLHTNLGRAPLGQAALDQISAVAGRYSNLELDLATGQRGSRNDHLADLIRHCTGGEAALVVNNNAAAVLLALHTLARDREVLVSRGELVEIGGSFRLPEIIAASGARMREVGTTNKTRLSDYADAINPDTRIIFKAHTSNYRIRGFTAEVSAAALAELAHACNIHFVYDIGSGLLNTVPGMPVCDEPRVDRAIAAGADLVTFSCDKLLGGPQAGIAVGAADLVSRLARAPMMRALRVDKLTIAALHATLRAYLDPDALRTTVCLYAMAGQTRDELQQRAETLRVGLGGKGIDGDIVPSTAQFGGGSLPDTTIDSLAVALAADERKDAHGNTRAEAVYYALLADATPVLAILRKGRVLFDLLTVRDDEIPLLTDAIVRACAAWDVA